jgi:hypothetical protein
MTCFKGVKQPGKIVSLLLDFTKTHEINLMKQNYVVKEAYTVGFFTISVN